MSVVQYELMRPGEVVEARQRVPVAFVPFGPLEWHGPHLPLGTDGLHAHHVAVRAAQTVGGVVLPAVFAGADSLQGQDTSLGLDHVGLPATERVMGMDYPGNPVKSTYVDESIVGLLARDLVRFLKSEPYRVVVIVNGHGAENHQRTLRRIAEEETEPDGVVVRYVTAWTPPEAPAHDPGHADRYETSILMALEQQHVDVGQLPAPPEKLPYQDFGIVNGAAFDGHPEPDLAVPDRCDPRHSTPEEGISLVNQEVTRICAVVTDCLQRAVAK